MSVQHIQVPSATIWRPALLALTIILGLTNLFELASTLKPGYWEGVGLIGLSGTAANDKLRLSSTAVDPDHPLFMSVHAANALVKLMYSGSQSSR